LEGLFEFLEEDFAAPAAAIQIDDGLGAPNEVVGQEYHWAKFAVHFDHRHDAAQFDGINFLDGRHGQGDQVIAENGALSSGLELADDSALEVVCGTRNPKDLASRQVGQVVEVEVSLVKDGDFARVNMGAKLARPLALVFGGGVHNGAARQEGLEVQPDMTFGRRLAPTMLGLVQGAGHQLDGGGVHDMNEPFETKGELGTAVSAEARLQGLQVVQHGPEKHLGHFRIAGAVGVRERVFGRRGCSAQRRQRPRMQAQGVADVIEAQAG